MMNIVGEYNITQDNRTVVNGKNIITSLGESFFLNRWINNEYNPITSIQFGKGTSRPTKNDTSMGVLSTSKSVKTTVDLKTKKIILSVEMPAGEIVGTSEIGVSNDTVLISHDVYETITAEMLSGDFSSTVKVEYSFSIVTGHARSNWLPSQQGEDIWYVYEPNTVIGVDGYSNRASISDLESGCWHYDSGSKNLYICAANAPDVVIVQTR